MIRVVQLLLLLLSAIASVPATVHGQAEVDAILTGRLFVSGVPADSGTVVLHRVTPEEAGDIDSTAVQTDGSFSFRLPGLPIPGSGEIFLASTRFQNVLYAGDPISEPIQLDSVYAIRAFPAQAAPQEGLAFAISRREIWVDEGPIGWQITDVLEILNPQGTTVVPARDDGPVWRYPLPSGAIGARVLQVGPSVGPARVEGTTFVASNPVVPAENYYVVQYDLESIEFDLPMPGETGLVQVMVREPAPAIRVEGLARQASEEIEVGTTFMRWAGQALRDQTISVRLGEEAGPTTLVWISVAMAFLLIMVGSLVIRREPSGAVPSGAARTRREILVEIAKLDEAYEGIEHPTPTVAERYQRRRAALVGALRDGEAAGGVKDGR